jgi:hypothetical protein
MPIDRDFLHKHAKNPQVQQAASSRGHFVSDGALPKKRNRLQARPFLAKRYRNIFSVYKTALLSYFYTV